MLPFLGLGALALVAPTIDPRWHDSVARLIVAGFAAIGLLCVAMMMTSMVLFALLTYRNTRKARAVLKALERRTL